MLLLFFAIDCYTFDMEDSGDEKRYLKGIRTVLYFFAALAFLFILKLCSSIILPIVIAAFLFIFINPFLSRCDRLRIPKSISTVLALLLVVLFFVLCIILFFSMVNMLIKELPYYYMRIRTLDDYLNKQLSRAADFMSDRFESQAFDFLAKDGSTGTGSFSLLSWLTGDGYSMIVTSLTNLTTKFVDIIGSCALIFLYLMFIILERQTIMPKIAASLPGEKAMQLSSMIGGMTKQISKYMGIKALISVATGVLFYVVAIMFSLDFPLIWGVLAFILNFIPTIGSIIVTVSGIFMAVLQFMPEWSTVVYIGLSFTAVEMVLGNIIDPKIQGVKMNLSPFLILVSLAIWGYIWGPIGMFLAVPITSILQIVCASIPSMKPIAIMLSTGAVESGGNGKAEDHDDGSSSK